MSGGSAISRNTAGGIDIRWCGVGGPSVFPAPSVSKQVQVVGLSWISMTTVASASEVAGQDQTVIFVSWCSSDVSSRRAYSPDDGSRGLVLGCKGKQCNHRERQDSFRHV